MPVINLSFWTTPFISDFKDHGIIDLNGEFGGGFWIGKYSVLFNTAIMYESAAEHHNKRHNRCQWTMRENFLFCIKIAKYFALSVQTGLGWQRLSVQSGKNNTTNSDYFILGNRILAEFLLPTKYITLQLFSDADCSFGENFRIRVDTFFRLNVTAYFEFINLFSDFGFVYEPLTANSSNKPYLSYQTGIKIQLKIRSDSEKQKSAESSDDKLSTEHDISQSHSENNTSENANEVIPPKDATKEEAPKTEDDKKNSIKEGTSKVTEKSTAENGTEQPNRKDDYTALYTKLFDKKKSGDTVELQGIYFDSHNQLWQQGVTRITALAKVLAQNNYVIAIGSYAESLDNPDKEISIAKKRSQRIKDLLISKGISPDRIKINANATVYPEGTPTSEKKIEIKIIK